MSAFIETLESRLFLSASPAHASPAVLIRRERAMIADPDDQMAEAPRLGTVSEARSISRTLSDSADVDMFAFSATAAQPLKFTASRGTSKLRLRFFDSKGRELVGGVDRTTSSVSFPRDGTYYVGVSHPRNNHFNPKTGARDKASPVVGRYVLRVSPVAQSVVSSPSVDQNTPTGSGTANTGAGTDSTGGSTGDKPDDQTSGSMADDPNDQISEALIRLHPSVALEPGTLGPSLGDVNLYRVPAAPTAHLQKDHGATLVGIFRVKLDSVPQPGSGLLLRLFDPEGHEVASASNLAPWRIEAEGLPDLTPPDDDKGRTVLLEYRFPTPSSWADPGPDYYLGVSSIGNASYDPITGLGDTRATAEGSYVILPSWLRGQITSAMYTAFCPDYCPGYSLD